MRRPWIVALLALAALGVGVARAEAPRSPYHLTWSFPDDELSAIDIDRGDLSVSRFASDFELVRYLEAQPKVKKAKPRPGEIGAPARELRVDQLDTDGSVRGTKRQVLALADWRKRLGDRMVERLEDEFDAHLRMLLPRKHMPREAAPRSPPDLGAPPP